MVTVWNRGKDTHLENYFIISETRNKWWKLFTTEIKFRRLPVQFDVMDETVEYPKGNSKVIKLGDTEC